MPQTARLVILFLIIALTAPLARGSERQFRPYKEFVTKPLPGEAEQTFFIAVTKDKFSEPLILAVHPSAARLWLEVVYSGEAPPPFSGWVRYRDSTTTYKRVDLAIPVAAINTADVPGEVYVSFKSCGPAAAILSVRVRGHLVAKAPPVAKEPPRKFDDEDEFNRRREELERKNKKLLDDLARIKMPPKVVNTDVRQVDRPANKVRVLMVVDTDADDIGPYMVRNEIHMKQALTAGLGGKDCLEEPVVLSRRAATPGAVRRYYQNLRSTKAVGPEDTLVFYYCGHGGTKGGNHLLVMKHSGPAERLSRQEVAKLVTDCQPGLAVIITDCCANFMQSMSVEGKDQLALVIRPQQAIPKSSSVLGDLLLYHRGVVNLTACQIGEVTWCDPLHGGHFTKALTDAFDGAGPFGVRRRNRFTTWGQFFRDVQANAMRFPKRVLPVSETRLNMD